MSEWRRAFSYVLGGVLALWLGACGGGSTNPTPLPTPTPPPPPPEVVSQGAGLALEAGFVGGVPFTTTRAGSLEATVDWTFAEDDLDVALVSGNCTLEQFLAGQCSILAISASTTAKPERITAGGAAAGTYTLLIENVGPNDETLSYQVVLTPNASASASSRAAPTAAGEFKVPPRGFVELR